MNLIKEFKPALVFLGKFLAFYLVGNIVYGVFVESYGDKADPVTRLVTNQTSAILNVMGYETTAEDHKSDPKVMLRNEGSVVISVFEGCNGINVVIVFIAFLYAFGGSARGLLVFIPAGVLIIHLFNLLRIILLFHLASRESEQFYYYHKYIFTATLYMVVFGLWALWVIRFNEKRSVKTAS